MSSFRLFSENAFYDNWVNFLGAELVESYDESTVHGNDVMMAQFAFSFSAHDFPRNFNWNRRQKVSILL